MSSKAINPRGPRVPRAYITEGERQRGGNPRDIKGTYSAQREGSYRPHEDHMFTDAGRKRLESLGIAVAGAAIVGGALLVLTHNPMSDISKSGQTKSQVEKENQGTTTTTKVPERGDSNYNPGNYPTSGSEDVDGI